MDLSDKIYKVAIIHTLKNGVDLNHISKNAMNEIVTEVKASAKHMDISTALWGALNHRGFHEPDIIVASILETAEIYTSGAAKQCARNAGFNGDFYVHLWNGGIRRMKKRAKKRRKKTP